MLINTQYYVLSINIINKIKNIINRIIKIDIDGRRRSLYTNSLSPEVHPCMRIMTEASINDFSLTPQERRQRSEIMDAMHTLQSAVQLLCQRQGSELPDLKSRTVVAASQQSLTKLKNFVEQSFSTPNP